MQLFGSGMFGGGRGRGSHRRRSPWEELLDHSPLAPLIGRGGAAGAGGAGEQRQLGPSTGRGSEDTSLATREHDRDFFPSSFFDPSSLMQMPTMNLPMNVSETDKEYQVAVEVPGFDKKELKVNVDGNMLTVTADKSSESKDEEKDKNFVRQERSYSFAQRSVRLPNDVSKEGVKAAYENGILKITLPKNPNATQGNVNID